ncbi:MAG: hypothetical protein V1735_04350 [Nanoarchaeota archaeon]
MVTPEYKPNLRFYPVNPLRGDLEALRETVAEGIDMLVLLTFDSGNVPDHLLPIAKAATENEIPVFGVRQTLLDPIEFDLQKSIKDYDSLYDFRPAELQAGITPLQAYPRFLFHLLKEMRKWALENQSDIERPRLMTSLPVSTLYTGLYDICMEVPDYQGRIAAARHRFNSRGFDRRLDEAYAALRAPAGQP